MYRGDMYLCGSSGTAAEQRLWLKEPGEEGQDRAACIPADGTTSSG